MNHSHEFAELSAADRHFVALARERLRATETLDYLESARLAAARHRAIASLESRSRRPAWLLAPAALAAALLISVLPSRLSVMSEPSSAVQVNAGAVAALEWAADEAGPDFYRDLEFYQWLSQQENLDRNPEPNA